MLKCVSMEGGKAQHTRTHNTHTRVKANMQEVRRPSLNTSAEKLKRTGNYWVSYWSHVGTSRLRHAMRLPEGTMVLEIVWRTF